MIQNKSEEELLELMRQAEERLNALSGRKRAQYLTEMMRPYSPYPPNEMTKQILPTFKITFARVKNPREHYSVFPAENNPWFKGELGYSARDILKAVDEIFDNENLSYEICNFADSYVEFQIHDSHTIYSRAGVELKLWDEWSQKNDESKSKLLEVFPILGMIDSLTMLMENFFRFERPGGLYAYEREDLVDSNNWEGEWSPRQYVWTFLGDGSKSSFVRFFEYIVESAWDMVDEDVWSSKYEEMHTEYFLRGKKWKKN